MSHTHAPQEHRLRDMLSALATIALVIAGAIWVGQQLAATGPTVLIVLVAASITAITTGLGAIPFLFLHEAISEQWLGVGNAIASGLMLGASIGLVVEGVTLQNVGNPVLRVVAGMAVGLVLVVVAHKVLEQRDEDFHLGKVEGADAVQMLLIVGIMTVHSFAEGVGVGVSYAGEDNFGLLISAAIAIHNIPEGLAISLVLIPRGTSVSRSALLSIFSSIPQPLMAVPAFLFVITFRPFLPVGLGLAAGAMFYMVLHELLPEARENMPDKVVFPTMAAAVIAMLLFQFLVG